MIYTFGFTDPADLRLLEIEAAADAANERFEAGERARERALERSDYLGGVSVPWSPQRTDGHRDSLHSGPPANAEHRSVGAAPSENLGGGVASEPRLAAIGGAKGSLSTSAAPSPKDLPNEGGDRSHGPAPMTHKEQTLMDARHDTCWYRDPVNLAKLWRWLEDQGETPDDPAYFLERPEKWDEEWQRYTRESVVAG